jgi:hypothetical protein
MRPVCPPSAGLIVLLSSLKEHSFISQNAEEAAEYFMGTRLGFKEDF